MNHNIQPVNRLFRNARKKCKLATKNKKCITIITNINYILTLKI